MNEEILLQIVSTLLTYPYVFIRDRSVGGLYPQNYGEEVTGEQLHEILREIDTNMNGQVELDEYLQVHITCDI